LAISSAPPVFGMRSSPSHSARNHRRYRGSNRRRVTVRTRSERPHSSTSPRRTSANSGAAGSAIGNGTSSPVRVAWGASATGGPPSGTGEARADRAQADEPRGHERGHRRDQHAPAAG